MPAAFFRHEGIALVVTLLALSLASALGLALSFASAWERLAATNHDEGTRLQHAAESALALAVRDLASIGDWQQVLAGARRSTLVDGDASGVRSPFPGVVFDLTRLTNQLTCGLAGGCTDADVRLSTAERPWGPNNARWQPFLHAPLPALADPRHPRPPYVVVWIGDDGSEVDGDGLVDGGGPGEEGRYILRARAEAFGASGGRRAIEAELARICASDGMDETCLPGVRVRAWRLVTPVS